MDDTTQVDLIKDLATRVSRRFASKLSLLVDVVPELKPTLSRDVINPILSLSMHLSTLPHFVRHSRTPGNELVNACRDALTGLDSPTSRLEKLALGGKLQESIHFITSDGEGSFRPIVNKLRHYELKIKLFMYKAKADDLDNRNQPMQTAIKNLEQQLDASDAEWPSDPPTSDISQFQVSKATGSLSTYSRYAVDKDFMSDFLNDAALLTNRSSQRASPNVERHAVPGIPKQFRPTKAERQPLNPRVGTRTVSETPNTKPAGIPPVTPIRYGSANFPQESPNPWGKLPQPISVDGPNPFLMYANAHQDGNESRVWLSPAKLKVPEAGSTSDQLTTEQTARTANVVWQSSHPMPLEDSKEKGPASVGDARKNDSMANSTAAEESTEYYDAEDDWDFVDR